MKHLYIWHDIDNVSVNFHSDGGLVIITSGAPVDAWNAWVNEAFPDLQEDRDRLLREALPQPTLVVPVGDDVADAVLVFPNAGCC